MTKIDVSEVKKKILQILENEGPSVPTPIAKKIGMQPMFASAILSELLNEKRVKTSSLKVGSSPLYFIPGQEQKLESFTENLTGVEKEAYLILRDNKLLEDAHQEPKIRVALRGLKDFAVPIQNNGKLFWKYFTIQNDKIKNALLDEGEVAIGERVMGQKILQDIKPENIKSKEEQFEEIMLKSEKKTPQNPPTENEEPKQETITDNKEKITSEKTPQVESKPEPAIQEKVKSGKLKKLTEKDLFLENVKRVLYGKNIEILETISYDKKQVIAKARVNVDQTCILFFFDKKKPEEKDLFKAYKKAKEYKLPYYILTNLEAPKKIQESIEVYKHLLGIDSVE
jgi:DNA-binding Lrp family transcriptional regulator